MKRFYLVRVNKDPKDVYASEYGVAHALEMSDAHGDASTLTLEWAQVYAKDAGAARLKKPRQWRTYTW